jgi:hypothetical protein
MKRNTFLLGLTSSLMVALIVSGAWVIAQDPSALPLGAGEEEPLTRPAALPRGVSPHEGSSAGGTPEPKTFEQSGGRNGAKPTRTAAEPPAASRLLQVRNDPLLRYQDSSDQRKQASVVYLAALEDLANGRTNDPETVYRWSVELASAGEPRNGAQAHQQRMMEVFEIVTRRHERGEASSYALLAARYYAARAAEGVRHHDSQSAQ